MGFEKVKELNADTTIRLQNAGDALEGFYHGSKEVPGKYGMSLLHIFETEDSQFIGVWGSGRLNYGLKLLVPRNGQAMMLRVTCDGTVPSSKGNDAYSYTIEKDKGRLTDAAQAAEVQEVSEEDPVQEQRASIRGGTSKVSAPKATVSSGFASADDSETVTEIEEETIKPPRITSTPVNATSAANKAKVNQILGVGSRRS